MGNGADSCFPASPLRISAESESGISLWSQQKLRAKGTLRRPHHPWKSPSPRGQQRRNEFCGSLLVMTPLEPTKSVSAGNPDDAEQFSGEDEQAAALVDIGRRTADTETRDAVTGRYVDEANDGDDTEAALEDIARTEALEDFSEEVGPETDAIHTEVPPED